MISLTRFGIAIVIAAFVLDTVVHTVGIVPLEFPAHLGGLVGMLVTMAGIVFDGWRGTTARRGHVPREDSHAAR
ncbi:MAG: hypothetical protein ACJ77N_04355 [Chloroflexota bacterium]